MKINNLKIRRIMHAKFGFLHTGPRSEASFGSWTAEFRLASDRATQFWGPAGDKIAPETENSRTVRGKRVVFGRFAEVTG